MSKHSVRQSVMVAVAATSMLTGGYAFAANEQAPANSPATSAQDKAVDKDAGKLSVDGAQGFRDVALARLAIFDGRTADAKKFVDAADAAFGKAKNDRTVFVKAETALMPPDTQSDASNATGKGAPGAAPSSQANGTPPAGSQNGSAPKGVQDADAATPKAWLPVDGEISLNEDLTADPTKAAAVSEANKSLAKGDRQGAMEKLKVAQVDLDYTLAVVPLNQTINDVHQAATLVDGGKFYEASQQLRQVQDSTRYDMVDVVGTPGHSKAVANGGPTNAAHMTGASKPAANH